jgi:E1A/CREB-binding protein
MLTRVTPKSFLFDASASSRSKKSTASMSFFALHVYEHGPDSPPPNQRCLYISYVDSVHFMRPRRLRTFVYHELLICYFDCARMKGFATAHIWAACPPLKGDDYILYAKPEDQKTPRDACLRQWYLDMLVECQRRNICGKVTNMYDLYIEDESLDATCMIKADEDDNDIDSAMIGMKSMNVDDEGTDVNV